MRRRERPQPEPEPLDHREVRRLLEETAGAHNRGESLQHHPALAALGELCGVVMSYSFAFFPRDYVVTGEDLDRIEANVHR